MIPWLGLQLARAQKQEEVQELRAPKPRPPPSELPPPSCRDRYYVVQIHAAEACCLWGRLAPVL